MALTNKLTAIANAIRAKTGKTEPLTLDQMPAEIGSISGGGGGSNGGLLRGEIDVPVLIPQISFEVTAEHYYHYALYNGVRLPRIPDSVLASYPYAWIRHNTASGYYDLFLSSKPFYYGSPPGIYYESNKATGEPWYRVQISGAENATEWQNNTSANTYSSWLLDSARTVLWSNHDIPNGSADATEIYFAGTDPVLTD